MSVASLPWKRHKPENALPQFRTDRHQLATSAPLDRKSIAGGSARTDRRRTVVPNCRLTYHRHPSLSRWPLLLVLALLGVASIAQGGVLVDVTTGAPNNNDYIGSFESNPNFDEGFNLTGFTFDHVLAVQPSGGTTEYALRRGGNFTSEPTDAITLELGFGVGENFFPASDFFGLGDFGFDIPLPGDPPPTSSVFASVEHEPYRLTFTNGFADGFASGVAGFSIDVPDLAPSLNDLYFPEELPDNFPDDATAFTLRMRGGAGLGLAVSPTFADAYTLVELGTVEGAFNC